MTKAKSTTLKKTKAKKPKVAKKKKTKPKRKAKLVLEEEPARQAIMALTLHIGKS